MFRYSPEGNIEREVTQWVEREKADEGFNHLRNPAKRLAYACYQVAKFTYLARHLYPTLAGERITKKQAALARFKQAPSVARAAHRLYNYMVRWGHANAPEHSNPRHSVGPIKAADLLLMLCFLGNWNDVGKVWHISSEDLSTAYEAAYYRERREVERFFRLEFDNQWPFTRSDGPQRLGQTSVGYSYVCHIDQLIWCLASPVNMVNDSAFVPRTYSDRTTQLHTRSRMNTNLSECNLFVGKALRLAKQRAPRSFP